jgi:hypothetical protein
LFDEIVPGIFRKPFSKEVYRYFRPDIEYELCAKFMEKAPSAVPNLPNPKSYIEWLFLMQHHGVPTRLLDWSENIFIATFFAVNSDFDSDGEILTMLPWKLNERYGFYGLPNIYENKNFHFLVSEIFHTDPQKLANELEIKSLPKTPMAFLPPLLHSRMTAQQSCFTIHPVPQNNNRIFDILTEEKFFMRYIISKALKKKFRENLRNLGFHQFSLFPDLDGLSKYLKEEIYTIAWSQPDAIFF